MPFATAVCTASVQRIEAAFITWGNQVPRSRGLTKCHGYVGLSGNQAPQLRRGM